MVDAVRTNMAVRVKSGDWVAIQILHHVFEGFGQPCQPLDAPQRPHDDPYGIRDETDAHEPSHSHDSSWASWEQRRGVAAILLAVRAVAFVGRQVGFLEQ